MQIRINYQSVHKAVYELKIVILVKYAYGLFRNLYDDCGMIFGLYVIDWTCICVVQICFWVRNGSGFVWNRSE